VCKTWSDLKRKEQDRTEASSVRLMRPEAGVTRRRQTMGMLGEEVQMNVAFAGSDKKYIIGIVSVEIPTRCSFVIEFIIPKFIEGSACFERHTAHRQEL